MAVSWLDIALTPLAIGGCGTISVTLPSASGVGTVRVLVGDHAPVDANDPDPTLVRLDLTPDAVGEAEAPFWRATMTAGLQASFFAFVSGAWEAGPVITGIDLTPFFIPTFPWDAEWVVDRLQDIATTLLPLPGKPLRITRAFPRDAHAWPALNVQVDALTPVGSMVGDIMGSQIGGSRTNYLKGRIYSLQLSVVAWCATPEERSYLGAWLGGAMETVLDASRSLGWQDPSVSFRESEDFETLGVPAFLVTANLTVTLISTLQINQRNTYRATL